MWKCENVIDKKKMIDKNFKILKMTSDICFTNIFICFDFSSYTNSFNVPNKRFTIVKSTEDHKLHLVFVHFERYRFEIWCKHPVEPPL